MFYGIDLLLFTRAAEEMLSLSISLDHSGISSSSRRRAFSSRGVSSCCRVLFVLSCVCLVSFLVSFFVVSSSISDCLCRSVSFPCCVVVVEKGNRKQRGAT